MFLVDFKFIDVNLLTQELSQQHRAHLATAYNNGQLLFGGPKVPRTGGLIISMHDNQQELEELLDTDPIIGANLATYEIVEFSPALMTDSMSPILTTSNSH